MEAILEALEGGPRPWGELSGVVQGETEASATTARRARDKLKENGRIDKRRISRSDGKPGGSPTEWFRMDLLDHPAHHLADGQVNPVELEQAALR